MSAIVTLVVLHVLFYIMRKDMNNYTVCRLLSYFPATVSSARFQWLRDDNRFDCIVGITVGDQPAGMGTLISNDKVVTSASPLEPYLLPERSQYKDPSHKIGVKIRLYVIGGQWNRDRTLAFVRFEANVSNRLKAWIKTGYTKRHSPIHDLIFITVKRGKVLPPPVYNRRPFYFHVNFTSYFTHGLTFAGFGYVDREHVRNNSVLETHTYEDSDEVDCDEWIPRAWGRFVCLSNVDGVVGVESGAPLFQDGKLRGIGSFALKKGKDSILVFTNLNIYRF